MSRKTGLIISWNWTRAYGIVQEQEQTTYNKGDIVMVMTKDMAQYDDAEVESIVDGKVRVKLKTSRVVKDVKFCCIREQPAEKGKQLFVHNQACHKKVDNAKGFGTDTKIGAGRVWYDLWERVYFDYGKNNCAFNVNHKE
jgi:hypothetical protein